jgi:PAS domain-containing protein
MRKPLGDVCLDIASFAKSRKHDFLSYILRLAAAEAYKSTPDETFELPMKRGLGSRELIAGVWDWDIPNGLIYFDAVSADFFNLDPTQASRGMLESEALLQAIHPDDFERVRSRVLEAMRTGGAYECEYRLVKNDRIIWVFARGSCTFDDSGRPVRFPCAIVDITHDKSMH